MRRRQFLLLPLVADDWPQFRGPSGQGQSSAKDLPVEWSETRNIRWKTAVPGAGWSSPSIVDDRIWLTTAKDASLCLLSLDAATGKIVNDVEVFKIKDKGPGIHGKNSFASPTAIVDKDRVYVHFGFYGTACLNTAGEILWKQTLKFSGCTLCG